MRGNQVGIPLKFAPIVLVCQALALAVKCVMLVRPIPYWLLFTAQGLVFVPYAIFTCFYPLFGVGIAFVIAPFIIACEGAERLKDWHLQPWFWVLTVLLISVGAVILFLTFRPTLTEYEPIRRLRR